jgi:tetratricopeptide (TPR) repeat protein
MKNIRTVSWSKFFRLAYVLLVYGILFTACPSTKADDTVSPSHKGDAKVWKTQMDIAKSLEDSDVVGEINAIRLALKEAVLFKKGDERQVETYYMLYRVLYNANKSGEAIEMLKNSVDSARNGKSMSLEYGCLSEYTSYCLKTADYPEAIKGCERLREIVGLVYGRSHPATHEVDLRLGEAYFEAKDYARAEPILKKVFEQLRHPSTELISRQSSDPAVAGRTFYRYRHKPSPDLALEAANRLLALYLEQNRMEDLQGIEKNILSLLDEESVRGTSSLSRELAVICRMELSKGRSDFPKAIYLRLLELQLKAKGPARDPLYNTALGLQPLVASGLQGANKPSSEVEEVYLRMMEAEEKSFGTDSRECDQAIANYTQFLQSIGMEERAIPLFERQLSRADRLHLSGVALQPTLEDIAKVYKKTGNDAGLAKVYERQIVNLGSIFGTNSPALAPIYDTLAALRSKLGDSNGSREAAARAEALKSGK